MVCKEDVLLWFKDLEGYKRIDVLYELLNMCLPFELRFLGTCMEEIGKHTYEELRGPAIKANEFEKVSTDQTLCQGLMDEKVRRRVLIYLSLLSSRNYSVANWLYKNVIRTEGLDNILIVKEYITDESVQSEFLLLFIMALHHPAFTFEHKLYFHKILSQLIELGDNKPPVPPKPSTVYAYPPIYGPPGKPMVPQEIPPAMPVKTTLTVPCVDETPPPPQHIPGIPHIPPQQLPPEFGMTRSRPLSCGAPEVIIVPRPFPPPAVSPQISEQQLVSSPVESRTNSPHRTVPPPNHRNLQRPPPPPTPPQHQQPPPLEVITTHQIPLEMLSSNNCFTTFHFTADGKLPIEVEEQLHTMPPSQTKQHNGYRFSTKNSRQLDEQFSKINIDAEKPLQRSNSSSSSSLNQTPPETPSATPLTTTPQCSSRGDKARVNGIPPSYVTQSGLPLCDTTSPPPATQFAFNNCSVPYSMPFTIPSRSLYPHHYRPPFPFASYQTNDNSLQNTVHHPYPLPLFFSPLQQHLRHAPNGCFNCGSSGHVGQECTGQTIEDITQKTTYTLDYSSPPLPEK